MVVIAELALVATVVGWFLSPNITRLMEVARSYASTNYKLNKKLQKLVQDMEDIKGSLHPDSLGKVNDPDRLDHVWRLKDAIHDAEEILDLFELGRQSGVRCKFRGIKLVKVLENLRDRAQELHKDSTRKGVSSVLTRAETGPDPVRNKKLFFGYAEQYIQLVSLLQLDGNKVGCKVIAILGHGGMGKTELARQAFHNVEGEFDLSIWVHAYDKKSQFALLNEIWKSIAGDRPVGEMNVTCLQKELKKLLTSKRCLLVLDDVWNDEQDTSEVEMKQARAVLDSFTGFVKDGSRIVLTARAKICSRTLRADESIVLKGIKPEEITLLLNDTAELTTDGTAGDPRIQELLNIQVPRFKGSPLAAIEIGCKLKEETTSYTRCCNILDNIELHISSVLSGHRFSYHHLPPHLQRCFAFCSIFPYNWRFEPDMLAKMWTAHGFVDVEENIQFQCTGEKGRMEGVARGYFDSLVDRSLFQEEACTVEAGKQTYYVIHEHIHWMLRRDSAKNCISISRTTVARSIPATVRHLSVASGCLGKLKEYSIRLSNVRTLLVLKDDDDDDGNDPAPVISAIDKDILQQFKGVRVLDLTGTGITELPASIGKLKHVRYLGLPDTISTNLGDLVTRLLFLQSLVHSGKGNAETQKEGNDNTSGREEAVILTVSGAEPHPRPTTSTTVPTVLQSPRDFGATLLIPFGSSRVGCFLSPHISKLMEIARYWADGETTNYKLSQGNKDLLRKLAQDLEDIRSFLYPTSTALVNDHVRLDRLWRLKDDIHDAEEVLDLFELEFRASKKKKKKRHGMRSNKGWLSNQLKYVLRSLGETRERTRELYQRPQSSILTRAETGRNPVRDKGSFFGYQDEYAQLVNMLWQQPDGNKVDGKMQRVIAIVGHAGMGKTELARQAFQDAKGKFHLRIWVHAYGKNTEFDLLKEIWKSVAGHKPVGEMNVACLQRELEKLLVSKRCFLVLDDVWNHESATNEVERKQASLALDSFKRFTEDGSRIVKTTRTKICSATFKADVSILLDGIEPKEITLLLNHTATDGTSSSSITGIQKLLNEQVPRLKGSPLAAIEVGDALRKEATSDKRCDIFYIHGHLGSVCQGHLFTYQHLPPHLQRCFEVCSIFPYSWNFEPEKLIKMWIAHGFIEDAHQGTSMEDVARGYFKSLVDRSLFQEEGEPGPRRQGNDLRDP